MESNKPLPVNFKAGGTPEDRILAGYGKYLVHVLSNQKYFWWFLGIFGDKKFFS